MNQPKMLPAKYQLRSWVVLLLIGKSLLQTSWIHRLSSIGLCLSWYLASCTSYILVNSVKEEKVQKLFYFPIMLNIQKCGERTSLVVQWLRLHASNARDMGLIPDWGKFTWGTAQPKNKMWRESKITLQKWCSKLLLCCLYGIV